MDSRRATTTAALTVLIWMNRERLKFEDGAGLIQVGLTGWFWLGLGSSIAIVGLASFRLLVRRRSISPG